MSYPEKGPTKLSLSISLKNCKKEEGGGIWRETPPQAWVWIVKNPCNSVPDISYPWRIRADPLCLLELPQWLSRTRICLPETGGDTGSIPGLGRSPGEGKGNPLQYSCLENPMDRGAWWATVLRVPESDMTDQLSTHSALGFILREHVFHLLV